MLTVTTNAASSPDTVILSGNGAAPGLLINKTASPSLMVAYHGPVTFTIILSNTGVSDALGVLLTDTLPVSVTFARWVTRPTGTNLTADQLTWSGSVTAGQAIRLEWVVTHTGDYGERVSNVAQYSHASSSGSAQAAFAVIGPPHLDLSPARLDFGRQLVGAAGPAQTVVLSNTGQAALDLNAITITGDFSIQATGCPASLAGGTGCAITITFSPTAVGPRTGAITITSNDPVSPTCRLDLEGNGGLAVTLSKTVTPTTNIDVNSLVTYTLVLSNASPAAADHATLTDTLPAAVDFARWVIQPGGAGCQL